MSVLGSVAVRPRLWRSRRTQRIVIQAVFAAFVVLLLAYLVSRARELDLDFAFMRSPAGFAISNEWGLTYDSSESRFAAYLVGVWNTVRIVTLGIVLATILGIVAGVARLSNNWLVSSVATVYVEVVRNTPLLVQIVFWWLGVFLAMPQIAEQTNLFELVYLSNRGLALPWFEPRNGLAAIWVLLLIAAAAVAWYVRRRRRLREDNTGLPSHANAWGALTFLALAAAAFLATALPLEPTAPEIVTSGTNIQRYEGGITVTPQFAAVLFGLVAYTGAFIAEIVRGSIQALPRGQTEAASALGLSGYQRLTLVILPQALRTMIPPLTNQYLNLTKNSSLAIVVGYSELFFVGNVIINNAGHAVPMFILVIVTYQLMSLGISAGMNYLNARVALVGR